MSVQRCEYINCGSTGSTKIKDPNLNFYRFPKDVALCVKWTKNCGRDDFRHLSASTLYRKYICSKHFDDTDKSISGQLNNAAVPHQFYKEITQNDQGHFNSNTVQISTRSESLHIPTIIVEDDAVVKLEFDDPMLDKALLLPEYDELKEEETEQPVQEDTLPLKEPQVAPVARKGNPPSSHDVAPSSDMSDNYLWQVMVRKRLFLEKENQEKDFEIERLKRRLSAKNARIRRLLRNMSLMSSGKGYNARCKNRNRQTIVNMQLLHKENSEWLAREKLLALALYKKSPSAYKFMTDELHLSLPTERSLQQMSSKLR